MIYDLKAISNVILNHLLRPHLFSTSNKKETVTTIHTPYQSEENE